MAEQSVDGRVGVQRDIAQSDMGRFPYSLSHLPLDLQDLCSDMEVQRSQKAPEGTLRWQPQHFQDAHQHRFALHEAQMVQAGEPT